MDVKIFLPVAIAASLLAVSANASPIFNSGISAGNSITATAGVYADSFTTDNTGKITEIELALNKLSVSSTGSIVVTIYSDNGTGLTSTTAGASVSDGPGSLVATVGSYNIATLPTTKEFLDFSGLSISLSPNTEYFVQVQASAASKIKLYTDSALPSVGATSGGFNEVYDAATTVTADFPELQACVSDDGSCAATNSVLGTTTQVPEPASLGILGSALAGFGLIVSRRRRRRSNRD